MGRLQVAAAGDCASLSSLAAARDAIPSSLLNGRESETDRRGSLEEFVLCDSDDMVESLVHSTIFSDGS